jgi:metal-responsive CopG/Arc/MetJ family transcriptional regulator
MLLFGVFAMGEKKLKAINIDLPEWMVTQLDDEATRLGVNRKAIINMFLASVLERRRKQLAPGDVGYLRAVGESLADEWTSAEDEEAFRDLSKI